VELLSSQRVSAIILAGSGYHDQKATDALNRSLRQYQAGGGRVAAIGRHELTGDSIQPANLDGARQVAEHLCGLGHRSIGIIAGPKELIDTTDRLTGHALAAKAAGRAVPARRTVHADFSRDGGAAAAAHLLDADPRLTALVAHNDAMAIGALAVARQRGIDVPGQLSVVGFDDIPIALDVTPALTTVRVPLIDMGIRALTMALGTHPSGRPLAETAAARLVARDSSGPPP
jgi:LacI family transcriptional regulator